MNEPNMAADIANYIAEYVVNFIKDQQIIFARKTKDFIFIRMNIAKEELNDSEEKLTAFRKKNPLVLDTPDLQLQRARLLRSLDVNQQVFITLREQFEISKIEASKARLFINILDKGEPSHRKDKPKRFLLIFAITFFGFITGLLYQLIINNFKKHIFK